MAAVPQTELDAIARVLASGRVISGPEVEAFEHELAAEWGGPGWNAVCVSSGTAALQGALALTHGDFVAQPSFTFRACAEATLLTGATPVYVDVDSNYLMKWEDIPKFADTVISVDLFGRPNIPPKGWTGPLVIQDASQAFGCKLYGDLVTTSFYPSKNLGGVGEGGAILTQSDSFARQLREWRNHGWNGARFTMASGNHRMGEINAAVLRERLKRWRADAIDRREFAKYYRSALGPGYIHPGWSDDHTWNNYTVWRTDGVIPEGLRRYYDQGVHQTIKGYSRDLTNTNYFAGRVFSLPTMPGTDVDLVFKLLDGRSA